MDVWELNPEGWNRFGERGDNINIFIRGGHIYFRIILGVITKFEKPWSNKLDFIRV
jgi:hypothetical protein